MSEAFHHRIEFQLHQKYSVSYFTTTFHSISVVLKQLLFLSKYDFLKINMDGMPYIGHQEKYD